ncbi:MAG: choice-of-anchor E domain-containing protein [Planctomycetota bacterium]|jgi:hypothetical protein
MRTILVALTVVACTVATASAQDTQSYHDVFSFPLSPGGTTLSLPKFDDQGGTLILTNVMLDLDATIRSFITSENDSLLPAPDFEVSLSGLLSATAPDLSAIAAMSGSWQFGLDPADGIPDSGPDYHDFGLLSASAADSDEIPPGDLSFYVGAGESFDVLVDGTAGWGFSGTTDATLTVDDLGTGGTVTVSYVYVPEPSSLVLLAASGGFLLRRRR